MKSKEKPFVLFIYGPTAVGKTDFALDLAQNIPAEIVNGDSAQFYKSFGIGTAKPDWKKEPIKHHLFDIIDEPKNFSVHEYRKILLKTVDDIWSRGKIPIVVGGSGFYLKSIFFPPYDDSPNNKVVVELNTAEQSQSLWEQLNKVDPERASSIDKSDIYRLDRALFLWRTTGKKPSTLVPIYNSPVDFFMLYLSRDKDELYDRINRRTEIMVHDGWLQEVQELRGTKWEPFLYEKKFIGYDVLFDYLSGDKTENSLREAIKIIQQRTRKYAKRQKTFWKTMKLQLDEALAVSNSANFNGTELINLTLSDRDLYLKQVSKKLKKCIK